MVVVVVVVKPFHASEFSFVSLSSIFYFVPPLSFLPFALCSSSSSSQGLWCSRGGGHTWRFSIRDGLQGCGSGRGQDVTRAGKGLELGQGLLESWNQGPRGLFPPTTPCFDNPESRGGAWPYPSVANCSCPFLLCPHGRLPSVLAAPVLGFGTISCLVLPGATSPLPFSRVLGAPECPAPPEELTPVTLTAWACWGSVSCPSTPVAASPGLAQAPWGSSGSSAGLS